MAKKIGAYLSFFSYTQIYYMLHMQLYIYIFVYILPSNPNISHCLNHFGQISPFLHIPFNPVQFLLVKSILSACCIHFFDIVGTLVYSKLHVDQLQLCFGLCHFDLAFLKKECHISWWSSQSNPTLFCFMSHFRSMTVCLNMSEHRVSQIHWWIITFPMKLPLGYTPPCLPIHRCGTTHGLLFGKWSPFKVGFPHLCYPLVTNSKPWPIESSMIKLMMIS